MEKLNINLIRKEFNCLKKNEELKITKIITRKDINSDYIHIRICFMKEAELLYNFVDEDNTIRFGISLAYPQFSINKDKLNINTFINYCLQKVMYDLKHHIFVYEFTLVENYKKFTRNTKLKKLLKV